MKILAKTFRFDKGVVYVIPLPENFNEKLYSGDQWKENQAWHQWKDDIAYAREHPVVVDGKDVEKIKEIIWDKEVTQTTTVSEEVWEPTDLTEYNVEEGVRMKVEKICILGSCAEANACIEDHPELCKAQQVACLIEDDKS